MFLKLSIVIPVKNELKAGLLQVVIDSLPVRKDIEILWVSSKKNDGTVTYLKKQNQRVLEVGSNSRAARINEGIIKSNAPYILLHHPRSILSKGSIEELLSCWEKTPSAWGGFTHKFIDNDHRLLKFTSYYSNQIRFDKSGIIYLDHCIFFPKSLLKNFDLPEVDIFEDTLLSQQLLNYSNPVRLKGLSRTSAIRFEKNGIWQQAILNQVLKVGYKLGISHRFMNKIYEKGLNLNTAYPEK